MKPVFLMVKNPEFLFFDEATNALDANNEKEIMEHLHEFYKGKTVVPSFQFRDAASGAGS